MEADAFLNIFDSNWFYFRILEKQPKASILSTLEPIYPSQIQQDPPNRTVSRQISSIARSKSDDLSNFTPQKYSSPDSVLKPHLQTILSDKAFSSETPKASKLNRPVGRYERRKKQLSKSLSELEFEEVKGFIEIGFVFSQEDKDSTLVEIIPGLKKLGDKTTPLNRENNKRGDIEEASGLRRRRPYLSEAWEFYQRRQEEEERAMKLKWRAPLPLPAAAVRNEMDMKDSLKSWAHNVASAVR